MTSTSPQIVTETIHKLMKATFQGLGFIFLTGNGLLSFYDRFNFENNEVLIADQYYMLVFVPKDYGASTRYNEKAQLKSCFHVDIQPWSLMKAEVESLLPRAVNKQ